MYKYSKNCIKVDHQNIGLYVNRKIWDQTNIMNKVLAYTISVKKENKSLWKQGKPI